MVALEDPSRPTLDEFSLKLRQDLHVEARTEVCVPVRMKIPKGRELAPRYIIEGTKALEEKGLLVASVAVRAEDLGEWQITVVNPTVNRVTVSHAVASLSGSRVWDPGRDMDQSNRPEEPTGAPAPEARARSTKDLIVDRVAVLEARKAQEKLAFRVEALTLEIAELRTAAVSAASPPSSPAPAKPKLSQTARDLGHSDGWRGERYDPGDEEDVTAFEKVKALLSSAPLLRHPRGDLPFIVEIDASEHGLGAVLSQDFPVEELDDLPDAQNQRRATARLPVYFASRKTRGGEPKYAPSHLEACAVLWALDYFKHYVLGRPTMVFTDHGPLTWIMHPTARENSQLARYALRLQEYQPWCEVQYKPGRVHSVPDAASRLPVDMANDTKSLDDIVVPPDLYLHAVRVLTKGAVAALHDTPGRADVAVESDWSTSVADLYDNSEFMVRVRAEQRSVEALAGLIDVLEGAAGAEDLPPTFRMECEAKRHDWVVDHGILRRVVRVPAVKNSAGNVLEKARVLTPLVLVKGSPLVAEVLSALHEHPLAAHIGRNKMIGLVKPRFYWKGYQKDIADFCKSCDGCQRFKALRRLKPSAVMPFFAPRPFVELSIDLIGPLPRAGRMVYCLTVICHFSSWLWIVPLPSKEPKAVAAGLYQRVLLDMCIPLSILSDRGGEFINGVIDHLFGQ